MDTIYLKHNNNIYQYNGSEDYLKQEIISALNNKNDNGIQLKIEAEDELFLFFGLEERERVKRCELLDVVFNAYIAKNLTLNEGGELKQIPFFEGIVMIEFDKLSFELINLNDELKKVYFFSDKNEMINYSKNLIDLIKKSKLIKLTSSMTIEDIINAIEDINENMELKDIKTTLDSINKSISHLKEVFDITFDLRFELKCDDKNK